MAHEDHHGHDHPDDAADQPQPLESVGNEMDAAGKSLSDALRISFTILKVIMIVLVVAFLASGFRTVGPDERALVLRFGKIRGIGDEAILNPGAHWVFPYPIDELVKIPVEKNINLAVNTFWYKESRDDILGGGVRPRNYVPEKLDPLTEGYCLTRSQAIASTAVLPAAPPQFRQSGASDYNIVHTRWQINYQVANVEQFFRNVYMMEVKPGEVFFDVMTTNITPLLRSVVEDAVVSEMVHHTIDEALQSIDRIPRRVRQRVQQKLDDIESGIRVVQVQLVNVKWPKQVDDAFEAYISASQQSGQTVTEARSYADKTLNMVAGQVAPSLYAALMDPNASDEQRETLWAQATGAAQATISQARTYRTNVVETARASANYLQSILPEYRKRPELVAQDIYLDKIQTVLEDVDEKFILEKSNDAANYEFRVLINRDALKRPERIGDQAAVSR